MHENKQPTFGNGKICYLEIPSDDVETSSEFYRKTFGWNLRRRGDGNIAFDDGVGEVSGTWVKGRQPGASPGVLIYIMVDSVEKTVQEVINNGGKSQRRSTAWGQTLHIDISTDRAKGCLYQEGCVEQTDE